MIAGARFGIEFVAPFPILQAERGDRIVVRVGHPEPIALVRVLSLNYAAVADAIERGVARPLTPQMQPRDLLQLLRDSVPGLPRLRHDPVVPVGSISRRHLTLIDLNAAPGVAR
jgi:hypothetical protein